MSNKSITERLERIAKNSEEKGTECYKNSKDGDNLDNMRAMIACYRASISATLTNLKIQVLNKK